MQGEKMERWVRLCKQAATEHDPHKLSELIKEISSLIEEKRARLKEKEAFERGGDKAVVQKCRA